MKRVEDRISLMEEKTEPQVVIEEEIDTLLQKMSGDHQRNVETAKEDVFVMSLQIYKSHLRDLINKDFHTLKKRKHKMETMMTNLGKDSLVEKGLCANI